MKPEMHSVDSSNILAVGYESESDTVYVDFLSGTTYLYRGVPEHEYLNLKEAASVGSYFNRNFKNVYPYEKVG